MHGVSQYITTSIVLPASEQSFCSDYAILSSYLILQILS
ncbi:hypothetical protein AM1_2716 [Acaryochloris marina MBIC11017]|uniref:Uncharacterized protein n=1 Tax=Acaryochloris marina (strain MBIC 11017) TaxID=329726 RepID=B0C832_ACAM1|nr:hypothetical protein AM1_2716 [Acaryochloris marina MBIC11017]